MPRRVVCSFVGRHSLHDDRHLGASESSNSPHKRFAKHNSVSSKSKCQLTTTISKVHRNLEAALPVFRVWPQQQQQQQSPVDLPPGTIRIKAKDDSVPIEDLLRQTNLPDGLKLIRSQNLNDGSKVLHTTTEEAFRDFLASIASITILEPIRFKPKIKVLYIPIGTKVETVQASLNVPDARLLRTINLPQGRHCHMIFEIADGATFQRLITTGQIYLESLNVCPVVKCTDVPICSHCLKPGHRMTNCNMRSFIKRPLCARCGQDGHQFRECHAPPRCIHCVRANLPDTNHTAFDQNNCPALARYAAWRQIHTDYGM